MQVEGAFQAGVALHHAGRLDDAEAHYLTVLAADSGHPDALHYLGLIAFQRGEFDQAAQGIAQAIQAFLNRGAVPPPECHINLGNALKRIGATNEALSAYRIALSKRPDSAIAWYNLGLLERTSGNVAGAIASLRSACQLNGVAPAYSVELGECHAELGEGQAAYDCFERALRALRALKKTPDGFDLTLRTGKSLVEIGHYGLAFKALDPLRVQGPNNFEVLNALGCAAAGLGQLGLAEATLRRAHHIQPAEVSAVDNLATVLKDGGRSDEAIALYRALLSDPSTQKVGPQTWSNYLFTLLYSSNVPPEEVLAEHRRAVPAFSTALCEDMPRPTPREPTDDLHLRLKIAYLSGDLRNHPVAHFLTGLLHSHDTQVVDVHVYDNSATHDAWSDRLQTDVANWRPVRGLSDQQLADLIRQDQIDVLIDLSGHTADNRLAALAYRPAPVQVSYLGYPFSTGLPWIDWRIVDPVTDPASASALSTEQLWRLPRSYYAYCPPDDAPEPSHLPLEKNGYLSFGVSSNLAKVSDRALDFWAQLLRIFPSARLLWKARGFADPQTRKTMQDAMLARGVDKKRLKLLAWTDANDRWRFFHDVDVCLDTYPYNQATNTCEALWMGVPTLTMSGDSHPGRMGASILADAGLSDWVLEADELSKGDDYLGRRLDPLTAQDALASLRSTLRNQLLGSRLFDGTGAARAIEAACAGMHQRSVKG